MYPPIASPTSPHDIPMADLNIMNAAAQHEKQELPSPASTKSMQTLRNNIDAKNDTNKKRTSLKMDNGNESAHSLESVDSGDLHKRPQKLATVKRCSRNLDNMRYRLECNNNRSNNNNSGDSSAGTPSTDSDGDAAQNGSCNGNAQPHSDADSRKVRRVRRKTSDDNDASNENGNNSDSTEKRDSVTSKASSDDYFLCEKFKNTLNAKFTDAVVEINKETVVPMELLSPQEAPLGRRYAELTTNKSCKW